MSSRKIFLTVLTAGFLITSVQAMSEEPEEKKHNRLINEKSPYLIKHATNPVDWYPWGEEAFERARMEDKPVFLSIGYSTCHWCNVMEEESFSDPEVASLMNEMFVSIKVDREERPDIDGIYMTVCQMLTGTGGWPLTIIMTPEKKPFFAGTYFPKESRFGRVGMMELIPRIKEVWETKRHEVLESAEKITSSLREVFTHEAGEKLDASAMEAAYKELSSGFDMERGGFGTSVKFPMPHNLLFLLRYWKRTGDDEALQMVTKTLSAMRRGGVYDHLGFGFHRYSTDPEWLVPHFEKMLYDQALIALVYIEAYQATGEEEYASTAREIFTYALREMTSHEGGFYSAQSADSEGEEGKFYVWKEEEIRDTLDKDEAALALRVFNIESGGNFIEPLEGVKTGENILHLKAPIANTAAVLDMPEDELKARIEAVRNKLFEARLKRVAPDTDDKVLADWNGLMIAALARGAQVLGDPDYRRAAEKAADFILRNMRDPGGRLLHRWREGHAAYRASADDYALLTWGLMELYETGFDASHLEAALDLTGEFIRNFWDEKAGGFYFTASTASEHIVRMKEAADNAMPSSNSVAMLNLLRLGRLTANAELEQKAARISRAFAKSARKAPSAYTMLLSALDFGEGPSHEVVIVGEKGEDDTEAMLSALRGKFLPNMVVLFKPSSEKEPRISSLAPFIEHMSMKDGKSTAYVCKNFQCDLPTTDPSKMLELLGN
jgi:uncharacterized protein YyaL (SSP411 family)